MGNDRKIIEHYELKPHPEGGWFKRTYSSQEKIKLARGERICGSSILYYLSKGEKSRLHFLDSDEAWYFHFGSPVRLHLFYQGSYRSVLLGNSFDNKEVVQYTIKRGTVFGAELENDYGSLMSCSVCPGFDERDFYWGDKNNLLSEYPKQAEIIDRLGVVN